MTEPEQSLRPEPPAAFRWLVLVVISLAMFANYYVYDSIAPIADILKSDLGFSDENIGQLYSFYSIAAVLVLLIVFMVISELLARGKEVPLPETLHHQTDPDENQPIVAMDLKRNLYFDKDQVSDLEMLKKRVEDDWRVKGNAEQRVFVKADIHLPYGDVYPLIIAMHELGVAGVDLGTNEKKESK